MLPTGFSVRLDGKVRVVEDGCVLLAPWGTVLRLSVAQAACLDDGVVEVVDDASSKLARLLLDEQFAHPRPLKGPGRDDLTVVIPARGDADAVRDVVAGLGGVAVIVVDDCSDAPIECARATVIRHDRAFGLAEARNTGLRAARTPYVAFLDPGVVPDVLWIEATLAHFADPDVAMVVPRVLPLPGHKRWIEQYESMRPAMDPGRRECDLNTRRWDYSVPTTALMVRRDAAVKVGGFDGAFPAFNATDLCVRLGRAGWRSRFDPVAVVRASPPRSMVPWLHMRAATGYGSARLYVTKSSPERIAAVSRSWFVLGLTLLLAGARRAALVSAVVSLVHAFRLARSIPVDERPLWTALSMSALGLSGLAQRCAVLMLRNVWPVTMLATVLFPRARRVVLAVMLAEGVADWAARRDVPDRIDMARFVVLRRLDDVAFGWGLWRGLLEVRYGDSSLGGAGRKARGVAPVHLLNARRNALGSENPSAVAI